MLYVFQLNEIYPQFNQILFYLRSRLLFIVTNFCRLTLVFFPNMRVKPCQLSACVVQHNFLMFCSMFSKLMSQASSFAMEGVKNLVVKKTVSSC